MIVEPLWYPYATFDDEGDVNGVRDDAPKEVKDAYKAYVNEKQGFVSRGEPIPG